MATPYINTYLLMNWLHRNLCRNYKATKTSTKAVILHVRTGLHDKPFLCNTCALPWQQVQGCGFVGMILNRAHLGGLAVLSRAHWGVFTRWKKKGDGQTRCSSLVGRWISLARVNYFLIYVVQKVGLSAGVVCGAYMAQNYQVRKCTFILERISFLKN